MIHVINFLLKGIVIVIKFAMYSIKLFTIDLTLILFALFFWDGRFLDTINKTDEYIWKGKRK